MADCPNPGLDCRHCCFVGAIVTCSNCQTQAAVIRRQQAEIIRLNRIIQQAGLVSAKIASDADNLMSQPLPRGKWAYAKGARQAAQAIGKYLGC